MRSKFLGPGWSTALLFFGAPLAQGDTEQVIIRDRFFDGVPTSSPIRTLTPEDFAKYGVSNVQDALRKLPQIRWGGPSESSAGGTAGHNATLSQADGIDLRGLGAPYTLVLVNGKRIAWSDFGGSADVSLIPLSAVQRIEILSDGASAIYGADAVAGVINIVLREDFNGFNFHTLFGKASGGANEKQLSMTVGSSDETRHYIGSVEYRHRGPLDSNDRPYTSNARDPLNLLPHQKRFSAFLSGQQDLPQGVRIFANALASRRTFRTSVSNNGGAVSTFQHGEGDQWTAIAGVSFNPDDLFRLEINGSLSRASSENVAINLHDGQPFSDTDNTFHANTVELKLESDVGHSNAGDWRLMGGVQRRRESYDSQRNDTNADSARDVSALYGGLVMPLVGPRMEIPGVHELQADVAIRLEDYTDLDDTATPKFGVLWAPFESLTLRFTYGRSTRNPSPDERDESGNSYLVVPTVDPATGSALNVLALTSQNAQLQPEKAKTWTTGLDLQLPALPGFSLSATYFNIHFRNRIAHPFENDFQPRSGFTTWNPTAEQLAVWTQSPHYFPQEGLDPARVDAIVDNRLQNIAVMHMSGVDARASYEHAAGPVRMNWSLDAEHLTRFDQRVMPGEPADALRNTLYNPAAFRGRGGLAASYAGLEGALFVNYVQRYKDTRPAIPVTIGSWTTVDLTLSYSGPDNMIIGFNVSNVLNQRPPYVADDLNAVHFDAANASALGRFFSFGFDYTWH